MSQISNLISQINKDVCFQTTDDKRFRLRAAAIIIEGNDVLFATNSAENYYYSIGGAIELGETAEEAVKREVLEETGIAYEIDRLAFVQENFFKRNDGMLKGLECHEITFYFLMKPKGNKELNSHSKTLNNTIEERMEWLPIDKLNQYEAYPMFFRDKLCDIKPYVEHIVTRQ
ncbi:MAG: NUDIX domain-containing protein [Alphaproteobacteria bacterium]|nr:NUDIX domain-containing protein [Alphaproteobacteria bacterium]